MNWYIEVLKKYVVFTGRASRQEYWFFALFNFIITFVFSLIDMMLGLDIGLVSIYSLAVLLPSIAVLVRRLHDTGRSGWWALLMLIPLIGLIVLIVFAVQDSQPGKNQFGNNPKEIVV